jgi:hypothetical protein
MKKRLATAALAFALLQPMAARAFNNDGTELEPLHFGQIVITDNAAVRACTIPAGGVMSCDAEITILQPGSFGVLRLSDYDPTVAVWAFVDDSSTTMTNAGAGVLDVKDFTFNPDISDIGSAMTPNADGMLTLEIGATLRTRAGQTYDISPYRGTFVLQINY